MRSCSLSAASTSVRLSYATRSVTTTTAAQARSFAAKPSAAAAAAQHHWLQQRAQQRLRPSLQVASARSSDFVGRPCLLRSAAAAAASSSVPGGRFRSGENLIGSSTQYRFVYAGATRVLTDPSRASGGLVEFVSACVHSRALDSFLSLNRAPHFGLGRLEG